MRGSEAEDYGLPLTSSEGEETSYRRDQLIASRYRLVRHLTMGGMSELWIAQHADLNSDVVVKFLRPRTPLEHEGLVSAEERFKQEAQVTAQLALKTKHIVKGLDWGTHRGVPYLVMELVRGPTLATMIERDGPLDLATFARVMQHVGEALEVAHRAGIIHRDLKPGNILLGREAGELVTKVGDFGVAKAKRTSLFIERPTETSVNHVVGSPAYSSPEQLYGRELDGRSDVWSLGVVAYEALTGVRPFRLATDGEVSITELSVVIATEPFAPPSSVRADLPRALDRWFERALAKAPDDRFATAAEAIVALGEALAKPRLPRVIVQGAAAALAVLAPLGIVLAMRATTPAADAVAPPSTPARAFVDAPPPATDPASTSIPASATPSDPEPPATASATKPLLATPRSPTRPSATRPRSSSSPSSPSSSSHTPAAPKGPDRDDVQ